MNGRRAVVGLCMLCALVVSAFAAQGAGAAGTTAYTCKEGAGDPTGKQTFNTPHCRPSDESGKYGHYQIANSTTTEAVANNKDHEGKVIPGRLVATLFGTTIELEMLGVSGSGTFMNSEAESEMYVWGNASLTFTEVSVVKPANCTVKTDGPGEGSETGVIHTRTLKATTKGQGDRLKVEPAEGTTFATFGMEGESCVLKGTTFTVTGTVQGVPNGATTNLTEADVTAQNTLKLNGAKAALTGSITVEGRDPSIKEDTYKPLSVTT